MKSNTRLCFIVRFGILFSLRLISLHFNYNRKETEIHSEVIHRQRKNKMDVFTKKKRSEIMSRIRSKDTKIEILFRKQLWRQGFRYRRNSTKYFGKPDIVLPKYRTVIFVDSCFWHGCKKHCRIPFVRKKYWTEKIARNKERDKEVSKYYRKQSWKVFRIWEHALKKSGYIFNFNKIRTL